MNHVGLRGLALCASAACLTSLSLAGPSFAASPAKVDPALRSSLKALRSPAATSLPAKVSTFAASRIATDQGAIASETRRLAAPGGGFWDLVPGEQGACLYLEESGVGACAPTAGVRAGMLQVIAVPPPVTDGAGGWHIPDDRDETRYGVAPDSVVAVSPTSLGPVSGGQVSPAGLYRVSSRAAITDLALRRAGGRRLASSVTWNVQPKSAHPRAHAAAYGYIPTGSPPNTYTLAGYFGPYVNLTQISIYAYTGQLCENARDAGGLWAGTGYCTFYQVAHPYNGSYRQGWVSAGTGTSLGVATYNY
jgi:hypothetical protein